MITTDDLAEKCGETVDGDLVMFHSQEQLEAFREACIKEYLNDIESMQW